jgi:hypothetical protein
VPVRFPRVTHCVVCNDKLPLQSACWCMTYTSRGGGRTKLHVTWCHGVRDPDVCQCVVCVGGVTR